MTTTARRGRRPGAPDTRAAILAAARERFAEAGFGATSIRAVAADAGVDPALVHHYFGSKRDLFVASLALPVDPRDVLAPVIAQGMDGAGERILGTLLAVWDDPDRRLPLLAVARSLLDPSGHRLFQDGFLAAVLVPVLTELGIDRVEHRAPLLASQVAGLILMRYVLEVEPLASMPADDVVSVMGPTIQLYLTGPLP
ncbi:transcriptional regulator, TetR family [Nocardioides terrae]|uniref:Transcriptional regulator, TetR family n=1 Tax=Nocardioides terrae TaxID=574651 RepID=A0A1I1HFZ2_9ACTN|nr:TetR family transcriptional regulator [Nocardioides terrae]SFC20908.1 transcriptional regulator, TetR family [Nocardioides terrae]